MKNCYLLMIFFWLVVQLTSCASRKNTNEKKQNHSRTGEPIAVAELIKKYETEHEQFHAQETKNGTFLGWPQMKNKSLTNYCRKYLQHSMPARTNESATGGKISATLRYENENLSITTGVVVVQCKFRYRKHQNVYSLTRAPEPNCVYALKYSGRWTNFMYTIINKHCDFEVKAIINSSLKRKRVELVKKLHRPTGQPIAKEEYLLEYEKEHQELLMTAGEDGECIAWPQAVKHHDLRSYCHQYIRACVPRRFLGCLTCSWSTQRLHYQILKTDEDINVIVVKCLLSGVPKQYYYVTRALKPNCVYALLRQGTNMRNPFIIIFKHCDFEHPNNEQSISQDDDILNTTAVPKFKMKEEKLDTLEPLQIYRKY